MMKWKHVFILTLLVSGSFCVTQSAIAIQVDWPHATDVAGWVDNPGAASGTEEGNLQVDQPHGAGIGQGALSD